MRDSKDGGYTKQQELFVKKSSRIAASYLRRIKELKGMPKEMEPFLL